MKDNFQIKDGEATIKIKKSIYTKDVLLQATYVMLEDFYFLIDDENNDYIVYMSYKDESKNNESELKKGVYEFFDELIESASYIDQLKRTNDVRQTILQKALLEQNYDRVDDDNDSSK